MAQMDIRPGKKRMEFQDVMDECSGFQNVQEVDKVPTSRNDQFLTPDSEKYVPEKPEFYHQGANPPREETNNPSKSKSQQRLFGIAAGMKKGTVPSSYSKSASKIAGSMSKKQIDEFAKHRTGKK